MDYSHFQPSFAKDVFIAPTATVIGEVTVGAQSSLWFGCVIRGDVNAIHIGARTNIQDNSVVHVSHQRDGGRYQDGYQTWIGDDVTVGHMAMLHACRLEDRSFVGMKACVMDGAVVKTHAMLAAGAILTPGKRIPSGELWAGSPARFMRRLTDQEISYITYSAAHYVRVADTYRSSSS